jgi:hypothetical protein
MMSLQMIMKSVLVTTDSMTDMGAYWEMSPSPVSPSSSNEGASKSVRSMVKSGLRPRTSASARRGAFRAGVAEEFGQGVSASAAGEGLELQPAERRLAPERGHQQADKCSEVPPQPAPATESREFSRSAGDGGVQYCCHLCLGSFEPEGSSWNASAARLP